MTNVLTTTRSRRLASASIVTIGAALSLGAWALFGDPMGSSAAPGGGNAADVSAATVKLETIHQRTAARLREQDDDDENGPSWGHGITPEQAASAAQQVARARGEATLAHQSIELQSRNGRPVYAVRIGKGMVHIDADTGAVIP
jgi:hypothetical protein